MIRGEEEGELIYPIFLDRILNQLETEDWYISMKDEISAFVKKERHKMQLELDIIGDINLKLYHTAEKNDLDSFNYVSNTLMKECKRYIKEEEYL